MKFAKEPLLLNIEMTDFLHDGEAVNRPNNAQEIYLERLGIGVAHAREADYEVNPQAEQARNKAYRKQTFRGAVPFEVNIHKQWLLYFHTEIKNTSNIAFDIDYVSFKIVDKKVIKRTAMQEQELEPLRAQNYVTVVHGKQSERTVFALEKFTIPDDKQLVIEVAEKEGGRHQSFVVENEDIVESQCN